MARNEGHLIGEASEMEVALDLIDNGCRVAYTHGHAHPYDLIADKENDLVKIQVKTAKNTRKRKYFINLENPDKYDARNVDMFAAYAIEEDAVFYVPYSEMDKRSSVTFTPPEEMGPEVNRQRANLPSKYTFEAARSRLES